MISYISHSLWNRHFHSTVQFQKKPKIMSYLFQCSLSNLIAHHQGSGVVLKSTVIEDEKYNASLWSTRIYARVNTTQICFTNEWCMRSREHEEEFRCVVLWRTRFELLEHISRVNEYRSAWVEITRRYDHQKIPSIFYLK